MAGNRGAHAGKVALITGGNKGIGLETARQLAGVGVLPIIGSRDLQRGLAAVKILGDEGFEARAVQLDVTSEASIAQAATQIGREFGKLDILVNNAGVLQYGEDSTTEKTSLATLRGVFETNFFGMVAVTKAVLGLLKAAPAARVVNITSILGSMSEHKDPSSSIYGYLILGYNSSKAAVNMFTVQLAHELRETKIKVNAAHPGWVKTDMGGANADLEVPEGAKTGVQLALLPETGPTGGYFHLGVHMRW